MSALRIDPTSYSSPQKKRNQFKSTRRLSFDSRIGGNNSTAISSAKAFSSHDSATPVDPNHAAIDEMCSSLAKFMNLNMDILFKDDASPPEFSQNPSDFIDFLQNGYVLIKLVHRAYPDISNSINLPIHPKVEPFSLLARENISAAKLILSSVAEPNNPDDQIFEVFSPDAFVERTDDVVVLYVMLKLCRIVSDTLKISPPHCNLQLEDLIFERLTPRGSSKKSLDSSDIYHAVNNPSHLSTIEEKSGEIDGAGGASYDKFTEDRDHHELTELKEEWTIPVILPEIKNVESKLRTPANEVSFMENRKSQRDALEVTLKERREAATSQPDYQNKDIPQPLMDTAKRLLCALESSEDMFSPLLKLLESVIQNSDDFFLECLKSPVFSGDDDLAPITDILVINSGKGETCPVGYEVVKFQTGDIANINIDYPTKDVYIAFKRDFLSSPITDISIVYKQNASQSHDNIFPYGFQRILQTSTGYSANLNLGTGHVPAFLSYRKGRSAPIKDLLITRNIHQSSIRREMQENGFRPLCATLDGQNAILNPTLNLVLWFKNDVASIIKEFDSLAHPLYNSRLISLHQLSEDEVLTLYYSRFLACIIAVCYSTQTLHVWRALQSCLFLFSREDVFIPAKPLNRFLQKLLDGTHYLSTTFSRDAGLDRLAMQVVLRACALNAELLHAQTVLKLVEVCNCYIFLERELGIRNILLDEVILSNQLERFFDSDPAAFIDKSGKKPKFDVQNFVRDGLIPDILHQIVSNKSVDKEISKLAGINTIDESSITIISRTVSILIADTPANSSYRCFLTNLIAHSKALCETVSVNASTSVISVPRIRRLRSMDIILQLLSADISRVLILRNWEHHTGIVMRRIVFPCLLECVIPQSPYIFERAMFQKFLQICLLLYRNFRKKLKIELGILLSEVIVSILQNPFCPLPQRIDILQFLTVLLGLSTKEALALHYNYDNMTSSSYSLLPSMKVFENLILTLTKLTEGSIDSPALHLSFGLAELPSEQTERNVMTPGAKLKLRALAAVNEFTPLSIQRSSLEKLVSILKGIASALNELDEKELSRFKFKNSFSDQRDGESKDHRKLNHKSEKSSSRKSLRRRPSGSKIIRITWRERVENESKKDDVLRMATEIAHTTSLLDSVKFLIERMNGNKPQNATETFRRIAIFLHSADRLNLYQVGDFLGSRENECFNAGDMNSLRECYSKLLDFSNMGIMKALRFFCSDCGFWLPRSDEKTMRLIDLFAKSFCEDNSDLNLSYDAIRLLSQTILAYDRGLHQVDFIAATDHARDSDDSDDDKEIIRDEKSNKTLSQEDRKSKLWSQQAFFDDLLLTKFCDEMPNDDELVEIYTDLRLSPICPYVRGGSKNQTSPRHVRGKRSLETQSELPDEAYLEEAEFTKDCEIMLHRALAFSKSELYFSRTFSYPRSARNIFAAFNCAWIHIFPCLNLLVERHLSSSSDEHKDPSTMHLCIDGLKFGVGIALTLNMKEEAQAFLRILGKVTYLATSSQKGDELQRALVEGLYMQQRWIRRVEKLAKEEPKEIWRKLEEVVVLTKEKVMQLRQADTLNQLEADIVVANKESSEQRLLLREGKLQRVKSGNKAYDNRVLLFQDTLVFMDSSSKKTKVCHLALCDVLEDSGSTFDETKVQTGTMLIVRTTSKQYIFNAATLQEKKDWMKDIRKAVDATVKQEHELRRTKDEDKKQVMNACRLCLRPFGILLRKNQCPICAAYVCTKCFQTKQTRRLVDRETKVVSISKVKVCDVCSMLDRRESLFKKA